MEPWKPELHVTGELASRLITTQFPTLELTRLELCDSGWDNIVYAANGKWYFRFPQREMAVEGVVREMAALPRLENFLRIVPKIEYRGTPCDHYPWPFFGYIPVQGEEASAAALTLEDRMALAQPLGEILAKLHADPVLKDLGPRLPKDPLGRLDFVKRIPMTEQRLKSLEKNHVELPYERLLKILHASKERSRLEPTRVVHGDLHFRHIIVGSQGTDAYLKLSGLIDWGDIHLNDPAVDLQIYWSFLPKQSRRDFLSAYGSVTEEQLIQARSFSVFVNVALLEYALKINKQDVSREAEIALHTLLED